LALYRLYQNIRLNQVQEKVIVFEGVVSNIIGDVEIKTIEGREEFSSLGAMKHPSIATENKFALEKVVSTTIDELTKQYSLDPGFIKVDVEGMEHLVFDGARKTLVKNRPIILSELSDYLLRKNGASAKDVVNLIKEYNYDVINPLDPNKPIVFEKVKNILCLPKLK
jgi:FkbM family methyltransferase